jgi:hypothetical protein
VPQVELPSVVQHGVRDVRLHDGGLGLSVRMRLLLQQPAGDFRDAEDGDAVAAVGALARLDDPDAALGCLFLIL